MLRPYQKILTLFDNFKSLPMSAYQSFYSAVHHLLLPRPFFS